MMCPFAYLMFFFMWIVRNGGKLTPKFIKTYIKTS